jgi:hypothetical protein
LAAKEYIKKRTADIRQELNIFNPLKPSGDYMNHLLLQSVMLHFVFTGFVWFSL